MLETKPPGAILAEDERYNASLIRREDAHESLATFWVKFDGDPTPFESGQYMTIGVFTEGDGTAPPRIVQRPYSIASDPARRGNGRLRDVRPARRGRPVHAAAVAAPRRAPDADDRPEGQVHPRARRRPDAPVHLVGHRQRAVRLDDEGDAPRRASPEGRLPQRRLVRTRPRLSRAAGGLGAGRRLSRHVRAHGLAPRRARECRLDRAIGPRRVDRRADLRRARPDARTTPSPTSAATRT